MAKSQIRKILVTGAAGFIGSHLCEVLVSNYEVIGIDDLSSGSYQNLKKFINSPNFTFIESSIQNYNNFFELVASVDLVIHLAATVGVLKTFNNPNETLNNNIKSSEIVIDACNSQNKPLILASSSEIYGNQSINVANSENTSSIFNDVTSIRMAYSLSKMLDELKVSLLKSNNGLKCIVLRFFNVVGPNQTARYGMVIPKFIKAALENKPITIFGDGTQSRTFCDIRDLIEAIKIIIKSNDFEYKVFNLGGEETVSIERLADLIINITNSKSEKVFIPYSEIHEDYEEIFYRKPICDKFKSTYDWKSLYSLKDSIIHIIENKYGK